MSEPHHSGILCVHGPCNMMLWPSPPVCPREQQPGRQTRMSLRSKQHPAHPDPLRDPAHRRAVYVCAPASPSPCPAACWLAGAGDKLPGLRPWCHQALAWPTAEEGREGWEMSWFSWTLKPSGKNGESGIICPSHCRLGDGSGLLPYVLRAGSFL